ncbi:MAG: DUF4291 domain-containing protein [Actinomycetia bacterium]|nr:DUF4291 domain-containing protein [Actinomycetes bacterium]MCP4226882.1 DUF4291 domain-containing protein [Actinomycetes bacterium]
MTTHSSGCSTMVATAALPSPLQAFGREIGELALAAEAFVAPFKRGRTT